MTGSALPSVFLVEFNDPTLLFIGDPASLTHLAR